MITLKSMTLFTSLPPAFWLSNSPVGFLIQWLALSVAACLLKKGTHRGQNLLHAPIFSESYFG